MPIRWSALKVSEAMDEVEHQVTLAEAFFAEAKAKATGARRIPNLASYMDDRLVRLITQIDKIDYVKDAIKVVRQSIPGQAIEDEKARLKNGTTQSLM